MNNYWHPVEEQWRQHHLRQLAPLLAVTVGTHAVASRIALHPEVTECPPNKHLRVERMLLRRLGEELRALELLAEHGHGYQAVSAAANVFEQSHFFTYISSDPAHADEFLSWNRPTDSVASVKKVVEVSGALRAWNAKRIEDEYKKYRLLCGFKHNNPMFHKFLTLPGDPDLFLSRLALSDGNWFVLTSVSIFALLRLSAQAFAEQLPVFNELMKRTKALFPSLSDEIVKAEQGGGEVR